MYDVAILGAGPCGTITTKALTKICPNLKMKVIEARPKGQLLIGAQIGVAPNGQKAMEAIDESLHQKFRKYQSPTVSQSIAFDENDKLLEDSPFNFYSTAQKKGQHLTEVDEDRYQTKFIGWSELNNLIQDTIDPKFKDSMLYGTKCTKVELLPGDEKTVQLTLQDGSQLQSKYLIGCDGQFSRARQAIHGTKKNPVFLDTVFWRGRLKTQDLVDLQKEWNLNKEVDFSENATFHLGDQVVCVTAPIGEEQSFFQLSARAPFFERIGLDINSTRAIKRNTNINKNSEPQTMAEQDHIKEQNQQEIYDRLIFCLKHFSPMMLNAAKVLNPEQVTEHGVFTAEYDTFDEENWGRDNILLLGDACHSTRPTGQGVNQAFEDVAVLAYLIKENGLNAQTFKTFAQQRTQRIKTHLEVAVKQGTGAYEKDRVLKKEQDKTGTIKGPNSPTKISEFYMDVDFQKI